MRAAAAIRRVLARIVESLTLDLRANLLRCAGRKDLLIVDVLDDDYFEIQWSNLEDSNVFYSTGIKNKAYVNVIDFNFKNDSSVEINKTNQTSVLISAINYENKELSIDAVPTAIAKQLVQGLLHKNLCINKVRYIANESPEVTVIKNSNLHFITASLSTLGKQFK